MCGNGVEMMLILPHEGLRMGEGELPLSHLFIVMRVIALQGELLATVTEVLMFHPCIMQGLEEVVVEGGSAVSSPTWEKKGSSEGGRAIAPSTPSRSRLRPVTKGDDTPDHNLVIPKFGDWDDTDPSSAEQFSQVFDRVRGEKQSEAGKVPVMPTETPDPNNDKPLKNESSKGCSCFPWIGK
ncbi:unnamed protein product [Cuscuta epithymum]|uniref:RIN4 pathogenic type III effector avirulence factor Avr cleavage site domain-containing protein n=1 Tax=Cuscuta epithymum TaxID=186058 RepID=A0AAV0G2X5_9ASTE|nr:unnamed protein product [Cuscuta epithymum]